MKLLLIEDDEMFAQVIQQCFGMHSWTVDWAKTWEEAESFFTQGNPYDYIITDNDFPGGSGVKSATRARQAFGPAVPVLLCSGRADQVGEEFLKAGGHRAYDKSEMAAMIKYALGLERKIA